MPDKQIHALSAFDCADLQKDYALALEKIAKLETEKGEEFKCFHCGDTFITHTDARLHFGEPHSIAQPACLIKAERGLVKYIRELEKQLSSYQDEDSLVLRQVAAQRCERANAIESAENLGYERGLKAYTELEQQLSAANERIAKLEERIRVADAEEPVGESTSGGEARIYSGIPLLRLGSKLYLHAQIPAEVELKAKIAELENKV